MWIFTDVGFFSIVRKPRERVLTVRARVRDDLEHLRDTYLPELGPIIEHAGADYPYRARGDAEAVATALGRAVRAIDYSNFKGRVETRQGSKREHVYEKVWAILRELESLPDQLDPGARRPAGPRASGARKQGNPSGADAALAYGGVVFDDQARVLLRRPAGDYDGYVWTFCKGRPERGETAEQTAIREVRQESGVPVAVVAQIPGEFAGGTTRTIYFLMRPTGRAGRPDAETAEVVWVEAAEARRKIGETRNAVGRRRDLAVLRAALALRDRLAKERRRS